MATYELVSERMLSVQIAKEEIFSKHGAMIAHSGEIGFARSFLGSGGLQQAAMRAVTNEGMRLMAANGTGTVYYAWYGRIVTVIQLNNEELLVESESVLAFDRSLNAGTRFLGNQGLAAAAAGAVTGQGLFTTVFSGTGTVALVSDGECVAIDAAPGSPAFADPQAFVASRGQLRPSFHTDVSWKTFVGQSSGESYQLKFEGQGTIFVQASER